MMQRKTCQVFFSIFTHTMTTFKISVQYGIKLYLQVKYHWNNILENLYKLRIRDSVQLQTVLALCDPHHEMPIYQTLKTMVIRHIDQTMRTPTSESGTKWWKEVHYPRVNKGEKSSLGGKWRNAISGKQLEGVQEGALVVSRRSTRKPARSLTKSTIVLSCP